MSLRHLRGSACLAVRSARIARGGDKLREQRNAYRKVADALTFELKAKGKAHPSSTARLGVVL